MTVPRLIAIVFILACVSLAWFVLAGVTVVRTQDTSRQLLPQVGELWGPPLTQVAPTASVTSADRAVRAQAVQIESSDIAVNLHLDYRQKGLLWYSTYTVDFDGKYKFVNPLEQPVTMTVQYTFPAPNTLYDNFKFEINGARVLPDSDLTRGVSTTVTLNARETANVNITYRSRGVDRWLYKFGGGITNVKNFNLVVTTDFREFDFPQQTVSSSTKEPTANGWKLTWKFEFRTYLVCCTTDTVIASYKWDFTVCVKRSTAGGKTTFSSKVTEQNPPTEQASAQDGVFNSLIPEGETFPC